MWQQCKEEEEEERPVDCLAGRRVGYTDARDPDALCAGINLSKAGINKTLSPESDAGKIGSLNIEFSAVLFPRFLCAFAGQEAS